MSIAYTFQLAAYIYFCHSMSLFGGGGGTSFGTNTVFGSTATPANVNPMKDFEVTSPPDDSVSCMKFSPGTLPSTFLVAGSWDNNVSNQFPSFVFDDITQSLYFDLKRHIIYILFYKTIS